MTTPLTKEKLVTIGEVMLAAHAAAEENSKRSPYEKARDYGRQGAIKSNQRCVVYISQPAQGLHGMGEVLFFASRRDEAGFRQPTDNPNHADRMYPKDALRLMASNPGWKMMPASELPSGRQVAWMQVTETGRGAGVELGLL